MIQLIAKPGSFGNKDLYLPNGSILLVRYPEGDCDSISWPFENELGVFPRRNLRSALFDAYETGEITERTVLLPDGTTFNID